MKLGERLHALHRFMRYRLHSERAELDYLFSRDISDGTVLDIGANRGVYSYWMHRHFPPETALLAFEPQPELCSYLHRLREAFALDRLSIIQSGLSSRLGMAQLYRPKHHWGGATVERYFENGQDVETLQVPVTTLDLFFQRHCELRPVRLIKCDAESHEAEIFKGGETILREDRPELMVEWHVATDEHWQSLHDLAQRFGYDLRRFVRRRLVSCPGQRPPVATPGGEDRRVYVLRPKQPRRHGAAA